jgi:hypothetical protein
VIEEEARKLEAEKRAEVLEMVGDLPNADAKPPPDMVFVCKLNPVTTEEVRFLALKSSFQPIPHSSAVVVWWRGKEMRGSLSTFGDHIDVADLLHHNSSFSAFP